MKSIIGIHDSDKSEMVKVDAETAHTTNTDFWDTVGSEFLGVTALPHYGAFVSEDKLHLFGELKNKTVLDIGCGNGHSLEYIAAKNVSELWGLDISKEQITRTENYLKTKGIEAHLVCSPMESVCNIPRDYFDMVYSVYAIGWTTDLEITFERISSYLKKDGIFIFSWSHPIHKCVTIEQDKLVFANSYFDESWYSDRIADHEIMLSNRKLSTYINALAKTGFKIEQLVEESDDDMLQASSNSKFAWKAQKLPVTFVIKARKL